MKKSLISVLAVLTLLAFGCENASTDAQQSQSSTQSNNSVADQQVAKDDPITNLKMQLSNPKKGEEIAVLSTSMGDVKVKLFPEIAPETVKNFEELIKQDKYKNVPIHRVINDFMIQMGDFENGNGTGGYSYMGPGTTIKDEPSTKLKHIYGALSMAKTQMPNSGGSQFFIVQNKDGAHHLDGIHTVFGQVMEGMDIVEKIAKAKTNPMNDRPVSDIFLKSVSLSTYEGN